MIFEEPPSGQLKRATIAGYDPPRRRVSAPPRDGPRPRAAPEASRMPRRCSAACRPPPRCLAAPAGLAACGDEEQGIDEPAREGLAIELGGVDYNVFITRELNPKIPPDNAYLTAPSPRRARRSTACSCRRATRRSDDGARPSTSSSSKDNQGNKFEPEPLPEDNQFAYTPRELDPEECIPEAGSVAQLGPDRRLDAAVPVPAPEHREPPAGARDRAGRREAHLRAGHLGARASVAALHEPASSTTRAAGAAVAPPAPAPTSITADRDLRGGRPGRRP